MRMRVLLLGGESLLGRALVSQAAAESIQIESVGCPAGGWHPAGIDEVLSNCQPDAVINLAFYHEQFQLGMQDASELARQYAFSERLIAACATRRAMLFMLSSARVFDGLKSTPYTEKDEMAPADPLGQLQAVLEKMLQQASDQHLILRFSWLLDESSDGLLGRLLTQLSSQRPVQLAEEWRGNPTPINDAARVMLALLKQVDCDAPLYGVYHYGSSEISSWISFAKSLIQELLASRQLEADPVVQPVPFVPQPATGGEPQNAALACRRILMACGVKPRPWRSQLPELLGAFAKA
ncbi:MAG TPA: NAD-dependent epimerase/dehydratase family protein [Pseudomonas xinjiangensis]|uniref:dTDP-4-dehydrorhamnose reductase n=2 Tax=root TaxID=1 RepID=A0A7V1BR80_9GAMM|nr:NAD-dependent epimerase/dehydratase family protein [Halopseudomonas xinjiangensis]HEC48892.1 NAD-dependent epimerase/dehydratase family protein [Halopseudomonas xinjiangensis]